MKMLAERMVQFTLVVFASALSFGLPRNSLAASANQYLKQSDAWFHTPEARVQAGADLFAAVKITGIRQIREGRNKVIVADTNAPSLWSRFYEIETGRPFLSGRVGARKYSIADFEAERRNGYSWYGSWGKQIVLEDAKRSGRWLKPAPKSP